MPNVRPFLAVACLIVAILQFIFAAYANKGPNALYSQTAMFCVAGSIAFLAAAVAARK